MKSHLNHPLKKRVRPLHGLAIALVVLFNTPINAFESGNHPSVTPLSPTVEDTLSTSTNPPITDKQDSISPIEKEARAQKELQRLTKLKALLESAYRYTDDKMIYLVDGKKTLKEAFTQIPVEEIKGMKIYLANHQGRLNFRTPDGRRKSICVVSTIHSQNFMKRGEKDNSTKTDNQELPQFPGGEEVLKDYLCKNIQYPSDSRKRGIEGKVICTYIVEKSGKIDHIRIVQTPNAELALESILIIANMPDWTPGTINGTPIDVFFLLPITFRLP